MPSKEEEFKQRFAGMVLDLSTSDDGEAQALLGSLALRIISHARAPSWIEFKATLTPAAYQGLLTTFQNQGNELARQGQRQQVYAIEILAVSLVAATQTADPEIASGAPLLDQIIDDAIVAYREALPADPIIS